MWQTHDSEHPFIEMRKNCDSETCQVIFFVLPETDKALLDFLSVPATIKRDSVSYSLQAVACHVTKGDTKADNPVEAHYSMMTRLQSAGHVDTLYHIDTHSACFDVPIAADLHFHWSPDVYRRDVDLTTLTRSRVRGQKKHKAFIHPCVFAYCKI